MGSFIKDIVEINSIEEYYYLHCIVLVCLRYAVLLAKVGLLLTETHFDIIYIFLLNTAWSVKIELLFSFRLFSLWGKGG